MTVTPVVGAEEDEGEGEEAAAMALDVDATAAAATAACSISVNVAGFHTATNARVTTSWIAAATWMQLLQRNTFEQKAHRCVSLREGPIVRSDVCTALGVTVAAGDVSQAAKKGAVGETTSKHTFDARARTKLGR